MFIRLDPSSYILSYELRCIVLYFNLWPQMIIPVLSSSHCPTIPAATSTMPATSMWVWLVISDNRQLDSIFDEWPDMERSIEGLFVCLCDCHLVFYSLNTSRVSGYYFDCFFVNVHVRKSCFLSRDMQEKRNILQPKVRKTVIHSPYLFCHICYFWGEYVFFITQIFYKLF